MLQALEYYFAHVDWIASGVAIWQWFNSPFICAVIPSVVGLMLAQRVRRVVENNEDAQTALRLQGEVDSAILAEEPPAAESQSEENATPTIPNATTAPAHTEPPSEAVRRPKQNFTRGADLIRRLKQKVDDLASDHHDGRRRRKYKNIPRYDYRIITLALKEDDAIDAAKADDLLRVFDLWQPYAKGKTDVPNVVIRRLQEVAAEVEA